MSFGEKIWKGENVREKEERGKNKEEGGKKRRKWINAKGEV
jgi:hypothetical protein